MAIQRSNGEALRELALFAGAGGGILGGKLLGWRTVCAVERDAYAAQVLAQRQNDGILEPFPIWSDVCSFDGKPWRGIVDVISGGFPCQDISVAGNGAGLDGERSGLWREMARIVGDVRPQFVFVENSPALITRGLDRVLCDLAAMGFDARWGIVSAADVGAAHRRERIWILANSNPQLRNTSRSSCVETSSAIKTYATSQQSANVADPKRIGQLAWRQDDGEHDRPEPCADGEYKDMANSNGNGIQGLVAKSQSRTIGRQARLYGGAGIFPRWPADPADAPESGLGRVAHGVADRVDRLKAIGNGQVPICAAMAFRLLAGGNQ